MTEERLTFYRSVETSPDPSDDIWALFTGNDRYTVLLPCQFCEVHVQVTGQLERDGENAVLVVDEDLKDAYSNHLGTHGEQS